MFIIAREPNLWVVNHMCSFVEIHQREDLVFFVVFYGDYTLEKHCRGMQGKCNTKEETLQNL